MCAENDHKFCRINDLPIYEHRRPQNPKDNNDGRLSNTTTDVSHAHGRVLAVLQVEMRKLRDQEPPVHTVFRVAVLVEVPGDNLTISSASQYLVGEDFLRVIHPNYV